MSLPRLGRHRKFLRRRYIRGWSQLRAAVCYVISAAPLWRHCDRRVHAVSGHVRRGAQHRDLPGVPSEEDEGQFPTEYQGQETVAEVECN